MQEGTWHAEPARRGTSATVPPVRAWRVSAHHPLFAATPVCTIQYVLYLLVVYSGTTNRARWIPRHTKHYCNVSILPREHSNISPSHERSKKRMLPRARPAPAPEAIPVPTREQKTCRVRGESVVGVAMAWRCMVVVVCSMVVVVVVVI